MNDSFLILLNNLKTNSHKPIIVAEMSGNHNQSLERALAIVDAAALAGADAIKLQTYTADTMTIPGALTISDKKSLWYGRELHDLYKEAYTPWEWHEPIFKRAKEKGLFAFSSPFDETAVDFLEKLNVPCYKIASLENTDWPLLKKVAATGKPVIMSTGVSSIEDLASGVQVLKENGCKNLVLLKCTSTYPASPDNSNVVTIPHMEKLFNCIVGISDHTMGIGTSIAAVALGAKVVEKHFTLSRADGGIDSAFSIEPTELNNLVIESERAFQSLGTIQYGILAAEKESVAYKRSIYITKDIKAGQLYTKENIKVIRPGYGISPKFYDIVIGKKSNRDIKSGTPLTWDIL
jgi:pseudaminic acid synthase